MDELYKKIDEKIDECFSEAKRYEDKEWYDESRIYYNKALTWQEVRKLIASLKK